MDIDKLGHYEIREEIGAGGMSVVYRARDERDGREVALKVLAAGALADPDSRRRMAREARTVSALSHPNIVRVLEVGSAGGSDFLAMELIEGQGLDRVIGEGGLPLARALRYAVRIADALAATHEHGVIHRDLKPQNVMITSGDEVKILDFGIAKRFDVGGGAEQTWTLTVPGARVGTPAYMSPEQVDGEPVRAASDVFSFGSLLYEMLTGVVPFKRRNAVLTFQAIVHDDPEPLRMLRPELPAELEVVLRRALARAPEERYASMAELGADLERLRGRGAGPAARLRRRLARWWRSLRG